MNFFSQRQRMVEEQLRRRDIVDEGVLRVISQTPREEFVPRQDKTYAYSDAPVPIGEGQTISQPYIVALMSQLLRLTGKEKVLEIGTGSGYQTVILSKLVRFVYTVERNKVLLEQAQKRFKKFKIGNIKSKLGDGAKGWEEYSPYNGIIVTAAARRVPRELIEQLAEGGRLVIPVGGGLWQELIRLTKKGKKLVEENFGNCAFVPLIEEARLDSARQGNA